MADRRLCRNCEAAVARPRGWLCWACTQYRKRHGVDRPEELVVTQGERVLARRHSVCVPFPKVG